MLITQLDAPILSQNEMFFFKRPFTHGLGWSSVSYPNLGTSNWKSKQPSKILCGLFTKSLYGLFPTSHSLRCCGAIGIVVGDEGATVSGNVAFSTATKTCGIKVRDWCCTLNDLPKVISVARVPCWRPLATQSRINWWKLVCPRRFAFLLFDSLTFLYSPTYSLVIVWIAR